MAKQGNCKLPDKSPSRAGQATRSRNNKLRRIKRATGGQPKQEWTVIAGKAVRPSKVSRMLRRMSARA